MVGRGTLLVLMFLLAGCSEPLPAEAGPETGPSESTAGPEAMQWAPVESAVIRPGAAILIDGGVTNVEEQGNPCTANFVFTDLNNTTIYLGLAAHCLTGTTYEIEGASQPLTVAYDSVATMRAVDDDEANSPAPVNDFALLRVDPADHDKVNPAMLHFGGPAGLQESADLAADDRVVSYGNTPLRPGPDGLDSREGFIWDTTDRYSNVYWEGSPALPGDSGSGVMTADGAAVGVLIQFHTVDARLIGIPSGPTGTNKLFHLDHALEYAREHADLDVRLATWPLA